MSYLLARADARSIPLADESVQCVVCSPPYWGLRDYGIEGQIGLEATPDDFAAASVAVFREVHRVLRRDGTCWLNLGDSFAGSWGNQGRKEERGTQRPINGPMIQNLKPYPMKVSGTGTIPSGSHLKPKDLVGIPWRVAFALQADGWYLRSDIIWSKPNPMPESVEDRPTKSHEYLFLLAKSERYFYDAEAIREKCESSPSDVRKMEEQRPRIGGKHKDLVDPLSKASAATNIGRKRSVGDPSGRNRRSVWTIATQPYRGSHFAVMPRTLASCCIKAGSRPGDVVFDPFVGSGTTLVVAEALGRRGIGLDLSADYLALASRRIARPHAPVQRVATDEPLPLFDRGA